MKNAKQKTDRAPLDELVRRIRAVVEPIRIILFGSSARGESGPESDLDVLVVVPDGADPGAVADAIYKNLIGFGTAVDVVVVTEGDLERYGDRLGLVYRPALKEGRELYAA